MILLRMVSSYLEVVDDPAEDGLLLGHCASEWGLKTVENNILKQGYPMSLYCIKVSSYLINLQGNMKDI